MANLANPAHIEWPSDVHGYTRDLRKAFLKAASGVKADPAKLKLVKDTVTLGFKHVQAKYDELTDQRKTAADKAKSEAQAVKAAEKDAEKGAE